MSSGDYSLGSGQVESDPTRRILHFGSPDEDFLPAHPDPIPEPTPTREPEPEVYGPEPAPRGNLIARWFRWAR